jgi:hypothetical protein
MQELKSSAASHVPWQQTTPDGSEHQAENHEETANGHEVVPMLIRIGVGCQLNQPNN